jgi:hypothetical protein
VDPGAPQDGRYRATFNPASISLTAVIAALSLSGSRERTMRQRAVTRELRRPENVVLQQMEHDDMASENRSDQSASTKHEPPKDLRSSTRPAPQPRILSEGLELPRSNLC